MRKVLVILWLVWQGSAFSKQWEDSPRPLIIAMRSFSSGPDAFIAKELFESLQVPYILKKVEEDPLPNLLKSQYDIVMGVGLGPVDLPLPAGLEAARTSTWQRQYVLYGRLSDARTSTLSYEDAYRQGLKLAIKAGVRYPSALWKAFVPTPAGVLNNQIVEGIDVVENFVKVSNKFADLVLADKNQGDQIVKKLGYTQSFYKYRNVLYWKDYYWVFAPQSSFKNFGELKEDINRMLYKLKEQGALDRILQTWWEKKL